MKKFEIITENNKDGSRKWAAVFVDGEKQVFTPKNIKVENILKLIQWAFLYVNFKGKKVVQIERLALDAKSGGELLEVLIFAGIEIEKELEETETFLSRVSNFEFFINLERKGGRI